MTLKQYLATAAGLLPLLGAAQLEQVTDFGDNPSGALMYVHAPADLGPDPSVVVAVHYCTGTAQAYYQNTPWASLAAEHNIVVVYPESPYDGKCWDVSSDESLTRDGGGNSNAIANMARWAIDKYGADPERVFVTGSSSGAMMTNVLAATYPDLFAAGIVYAGVPAGCFYTGTTNGWNSQCSGGTFIQTAEEWAQTARDMYPGYEGERPRMLIYHGLSDDTLSGNNYAETIKQWSGVFGYDAEAPEVTEPDTPAAGYSWETYGPGLAGAWSQSAGHNLPQFSEADLEWFGFV